MKKEKIHILRKYDLIIIAAILIIAAAIPIIKGFIRSEPARILVFRNEELIKEVEYGKPGKFEIELEKGSFIGTVEKNGVKVLSSPCRHKICMKSPPIKRAGECIVCVPNRIIVKIEGRDKRYHAISR